MKNLYTKLYLAISLLGFGLIAAQVGIGTTHPQGSLEVMGRSLLDAYLIVSSTSDATGDYKMLVRSKDTTPVGEVKILNIDTRNVAPINTYHVSLTNVKLDEVRSLLTNLSTSKYTVAITEAVFSSATPAVSSGVYGSYSTEVGVKNAFYTINLDFKGGNTVGNTNGTWELTLVVYEKSLVKDWGSFTGSVSGNNSPAYSGTSANTPAGLQ